MRLLRVMIRKNMPVAPDSMPLMRGPSCLDPLRSHVQAATEIDSSLQPFSPARSRSVSSNTPPWWPPVHQGLKLRFPYETEDTRQTKATAQRIPEKMIVDRHRDVFTEDLNAIRSQHTLSSRCPCISMRDSAPTFFRVTM